VPSIVKAIARARDWYERIVDGEIRTIGQLTLESGLTERYVKRILQCAYLSPQIMEAVLAGKHRPNLTLKELLCGVPVNWREQETRIFGPSRTASSLRSNVVHGRPTDSQIGF
jgi:site-specific DNA recombinase